MSCQAQVAEVCSAKPEALWWSQKSGVGSSRRMHEYLCYGFDSEFSWPMNAIINFVSAGCFLLEVIARTPIRRQKLRLRQR